jgi:transposase
LRQDHYRRPIRAASARLLFLPPHSPNLNPIEQVFAKRETLLRKAEERTSKASAAASASSSSPSPADYRRNA